MLTSPEIAMPSAGSYLPPSCLSVDPDDTPAWSPTRWRQSKQLTLARRVSLLDRFLGHPIRNIADLRVVQSVIFSRQECARRAYEVDRQQVSGGASWRLPDHLTNPIGKLAWWPVLQHGEPGQTRADEDGTGNW